MPRVKCGKCHAVIKLDAVPEDGTIHCTACGATFRVRTKASESSATITPAAAPSPAAAPPAKGQPDFSFAAAATPPAPKSGGGIDLGFLGGNQPDPAPKSPAESPPDTPPVAEAPSLSFDFVSDGAATPDPPPATPVPAIKPAEIKPAAIKPKRKPTKAPSFPASSPSELPTREPPTREPPTREPPTREPPVAAPSSIAPAAPAPPNFQPPAAETSSAERHSNAPLPDVSSSPYASPAPAITPTGNERNSMQAGDELLAMPAPSFMTGMFDGSFRYFLTPRIVKVFWILALVAAGIALTLLLGGYFLMLYGILVTDAGLPDGQHYAAELRSDPTLALQAQAGPSGFSMMGKFGTALLSTLYTLATVIMILMWLLFLRMILEAFCVLFGIRVSLRTMAERR